MITKSQKNKFKKHFLPTWINDVLLDLKNQGITSSHGEPYSERTIKAVLSGERENFHIEASILKVYQDHKTLIEKHEQEKREALSA